MQTTQADPMASMLERIAATGGGEVRIRVESVDGVDRYTMTVWRRGEEVGGVALAIGAAEATSAFVPSQRISFWLERAERSLANVGID